MQWSNNLRFPQFTATDICKAGNIKLPTLKARQARRAENHPVPAEDRVGRGRGTQDLYTWMTLLHEVVTEQLVSFGLGLVHANDAAAGFALMSDYPSFDTGEPIDMKKVRQPGQLYDDGLTFLVVPKGMGLGRVINLRPGLEYDSWVHAEMANSPVICLVDVSRFDRMARGALGIPDTFFMMKDNYNG